MCHGSHLVLQVKQENMCTCHLFLTKAFLTSTDLVSSLSAEKIICCFRLIV